MRMCALCVLACSLTVLSSLMDVTQMEHTKCKPDDFEPFDASYYHGCHGSLKYIQQPCRYTVTCRLVVPGLSLRGDRMGARISIMQHVNQLPASFATAFRVINPCTIQVRVDDTILYMCKYTQGTHLHTTGVNCIPEV